jgi:hypothetical protein
MSKREIEHSCGHTETHNITGPYKGRDAKAAWLAERPCSDCYRAKKASEAARQREATNRAAAAANEAEGLPALAGSEKQIAWAETIRAEWIANVRRMMADHEKKFARRDEMEAKGVPADVLDEIDMVTRQIAAELTGQTSAAWWIDHRRENLADYIATAQQSRCPKTNAYNAAKRNR